MERTYICNGSILEVNFGGRIGFCDYFSNTYIAPTTSTPSEGASKAAHGASGLAVDASVAVERQRLEIPWSIDLESRFLCLCLDAFGWVLAFT